MPKASWSSDVQQRIRRLLEELLSYVLDYRDDIQLKYRWDDEDGGRPKLIVEAKRRFLVELAKFEKQNHFYEAVERLEELNIYEDRRFHKRGTDSWHFALRLWSKDKQNNLSEFDKAWEQKKPQKSKQIEDKKLKSQISKQITFRYANIPESGAVVFVGRSDDLENLYQHFQETDKVTILAIVGMGGVGKTELAIQYAQQHFANLQRKNCSGGVCWLSSRDSNLGANIIQFAKSHFPNFSIPDGLTQEAQVEFCWQNWYEGDTLLVLDDVTDYNRIKPYLPPKLAQFNVLITTREKLQLPIVRLDLDVLKPHIALDLLISLVQSRSEIMQQEADVAAKLCDWLGYLPLGLELVGRYLDQEPDVSFAEMLQRLEKRRIRHVSLIDAKPEMTAQLGVSAAFELSWERLDTNAQELGCLLSLFALAPIPWLLVKNIVEKTVEDLSDKSLEIFEENLEKARSNLLRKHLLQRTNNETYCLHQLIREFLLEKLVVLPQADNFKQLFVAAMVAIAKQISQSPTRENISAVIPVIPHLQQVANQMINHLQNQNLGYPFLGLIDFYKGQGFYDLAEVWCYKFLEVVKSRLGSDNLSVALASKELALIYKLQGQYKKSENLYLQALKTCQKLLGNNHLIVPKIQNNLGLIYSLQGRFLEAEQLYIDSLENSKGTLEKDASTFTYSFNNLGNLYFSLGRYDDAEKLFLEAIEFYNSNFQQDSMNIIPLLNNLASLYQHQGLYNKAESVFLKALEIAKHLLVENHPDIATTLNNLALVYKSQGRYDEAQQLYLKALQFQKQLLGNNHPNIVSTLNNLGHLYNLTKNYSESQKCFQEALHSGKILLGENHPDYAITLNNLALVIMEQGNYEKSKVLFIKSLQIKQNLLGENHSEVAATLNNIGLIHFYQSEYRQAEEFYFKALKIRKTTLGSNHPDVANSLHNLAEVRICQTRFDEAEDFWKQALEIGIQKLGKKHPDTILYHNSLQSIPLLRTLSPQEMKIFSQQYKHTKEANNPKSKKYKNPLAEYKNFSEDI